MQYNTNKRKFFLELLMATLPLWRQNVCVRFDKFSPVHLRDKNLPLLEQDSSRPFCLAFACQPNILNFSTNHGPSRTRHWLKRVVWHVDGGLIVIWFFEGSIALYYYLASFAVLSVLKGMCSSFLREPKMKIPKKHRKTCFPSYVSFQPQHRLLICQFHTVLHDGCANSVDSFSGIENWLKIRAAICGFGANMC